MKLLVIGGTYFLGKVFLDLCDNGENEILMVNRGNRLSEFGGSSGVKFFRMDRHDEGKLQELSGLLHREPVEAVVDFCAYEPGDIRTITEILPDSVKQYVFISTCDVYRRGSGKALDETAPLEERDFGGQEGAYILGKVALEKELRECAPVKGIHYTVIRPAIIYGPGNYAPREGMFFHWIANAGQILLPEDADGAFQMVYVGDVAKLISDVLLKKECYDQAYNICGDEVVNYESFAGALARACSQEPERVFLKVSEILERGIPLPFPLTKAESESYLDEKRKTLGVSCTPLAEGLKESYLWYLRQEGMQ